MASGTTFARNSSGRQGAARLLLVARHPWCRLLHLGHRPCLERSSASTSGSRNSLGEEVTVGQFLDEVRGLVTDYALDKIMKTTHTATIDPESRFYVVWKWSYGDAKVPADERSSSPRPSAWTPKHVGPHRRLGEVGRERPAVPVAKRMKIKDLGEPNADGTPASLIDVLHRLCVFRDKGDTDGMAEFLPAAARADNPALWLVAQAVSEILPDGDKEKQLMQGLLNQKDRIGRGDTGRGVVLGGCR